MAASFQISKVPFSCIFKQIFSSEAPYILDHTEALEQLQDWENFGYQSPDLTFARGGQRIAKMRPFGFDRDDSFGDLI